MALGPPVYWRGGPLLAARPVLRAGPAHCYPRLLPAPLGARHSAPRLLAWGAPARSWAFARARPSRCYPRLLPAPYGVRHSAPRLLAWGAPARSWASLARWTLALLPAPAARGVEYGAVQHCSQHPLPDACSLSVRLVSHQYSLGPHRSRATSGHTLAAGLTLIPAPL